METKQVKFIDKDSFTVYCQEIGKNFCPYLIISEKENVLFKTEISFDSQTTLPQVQEILFYYGLYFTEELRIFRLANPNKKGLFYCNNIVFKVPDHLKKIDGNVFIEWPHWILKCLYSKVGIMFGKFWIGETLISRTELEINSPPIHFLSIRSAIKQKDPYFLTNTPFFLQEMLESVDLGENILKEFNIPNDKLKDIQHLFENNYYSLLLEWSKNKLPL